MITKLERIYFGVDHLSCMLGVALNQNLTHQGMRAVRSEPLLLPCIFYEC